MTSSNDCNGTVFDPEFGTVPVVDARDEFKELSESVPRRDNEMHAAMVRKKARRLRSKSASGAQPASTTDEEGDSRAIGFWPQDGMLLFATFTAARYKILFPNTAGGDSTGHIYLTSTNRSEKGTESHIAFVGQRPPEFWIYDWSIADKNCRLARVVPISKINKYVFPLVIRGLQRNGILVMNQTRYVDGLSWTNCVHLGVFKNAHLDHYETVYSNLYELDCDREQQPLCNGYWGPQLEAFRFFREPINAMGFSGSWLIQDGEAHPLDNSNTVYHEGSDIGLTIFYQNPNRDFLVH